MPYAELPPDFPEPRIPPKKFWEDARWVDYTELVHKYPDQWIAEILKGDSGIYP